MTISRIVGGFQDFLFVSPLLITGGNDPIWAFCLWNHQLVCFANQMTPGIVRIAIHCGKNQNIQCYVVVFGIDASLLKTCPFAWWVDGHWLQPIRDSLWWRMGIFYVVVSNRSIYLTLLTKLQHFDYRVMLPMISLSLPPWSPDV